MTEAFIQQFEVGHCIVCLEPDLGDQVNDDNALNILQLQNTNHAAVDFHHAVLLFRLFLTLQHCQAGRHGQVGPAGESKIAAQRHDSDITGFGAEPSIGKIGALKGKKNGVGEKVASRESHRLSGGSV